MLNREQFLQRQIVQLLSDRYDATEAGAAARHAIDFMQSHRNATTEMVISEAKRFAKHNHRPAAPERTGPIVKARLSHRVR
ncbi:hypothetical protein [Klebsiella aerogenes]|uniref:hypothetical protein n=1 Tax=Klebsiella aerogenes TaxID=548 RepID=UPI0034D300A1